MGWNAYLYITYKILSTLLTVLLFSHLTTGDFSLWANTNCCIFLVLLWIDFGLRKSIPRYCPEFAKNTVHMRTFLITTIGVKFLTLLLGLPIMLVVTKEFTKQVIGIEIHNHVYILAGILFITEGLKNILQLIFHAHFWNKSYNLLLSATQLIEMLTNISLIVILNSENLLIGTLATKAVGGAVVIIISAIMLKMNYTYVEPQTKQINVKALSTQFVKHSGVMWVNNNLKSLTERNFLIPVLTITLGPEQANIFKLANDGALFFYRTVVKTIGSNDTAVFSYIKELKESKRLLPIAFKKVTAKLAALCIPVSGVLVLLSVYSNKLFTNPVVFHLFFIITICYLLETLFSAYERVLEVHQRYILLLYSYIPYILMLCFLFTHNTITSIGLINSLVLIHGVRLVGSFFMFYYARREYNVQFPTIYVIHILRWLLPCIGILVLIMEYTYIGDYIYELFQFLFSCISIHFNRCFN